MQKEDKEDMVCKAVSHSCQQSCLVPIWRSSEKINTYIFRLEGKECGISMKHL